MGFWAAAAGTIFLTVFYMRNAYFHVIREAHGDPFQLFLQESAERDSAYAGKKAYVYVPGEDPEDIGSWDQNMLLLASFPEIFDARTEAWKAFWRRSARQCSTSAGRITAIMRTRLQAQRFCTRTERIFCLRNKESREKTGFCPGLSPALSQIKERRKFL